MNPEQLLSWFQQRDGLKKDDLDLLDDMFTGETVVSLKAELEGVRAELSQNKTTNQRINLDLENALGESQVKSAKGVTSCCADGKLMQRFSSHC